MEPRTRGFRAEGIAREVTRSEQVRHVPEMKKEAIVTMGSNIGELGR